MHSLACAGERNPGDDAKSGRCGALPKRAPLIYPAAGDRRVCCSAARRTALCQAGDPRSRRDPAAKPAGARRGGAPTADSARACGRSPPHDRSGGSGKAAPVRTTRTATAKAGSRWTHANVHMASKSTAAGPPEKSRQRARNATIAAAAQHARSDAAGQATPPTGRDCPCRRCRRVANVECKPRVPEPGNRGGDRPHAKGGRLQRSGDQLPQRNAGPDEAPQGLSWGGGRDRCGDRAPRQPNLAAERSGAARGVPECGIDRGAPRRPQGGWAQRRKASGGCPPRAHLAKAS